MAMRAWRSAAVAVGAILATIGAGDAAPRKKVTEHGGTAVHTCSNYGHGCTSAPVRRGRAGEEFRMPGGTWVSCRQDCRTALREEVLDFWETLRERAGDTYD